MGVNLKALMAQLEWTYRESPGKGRLLVDAVRGLEGSLSVLASHGHPMRIELGLAPHAEWTWPRTYYHHELGPRVVGGPGQLIEMGPGWYESPALAAQAYGEDVQFAGRGGVRRRRQLATVEGEESQFRPTVSKDELKAQFRARRRGEG